MSDDEQLWLYLGPEEAKRMTMRNFVRRFIDPAFGINVDEIVTLFKLSELFSDAKNVALFKQKFPGAFNGCSRIVRRGMMTNLYYVEDVERFAEFLYNTTLLRLRPEWVDDPITAVDAMIVARDFEKMEDDDDE